MVIWIDEINVKDRFVLQNHNQYVKRGIKFISTPFLVFCSDELQDFLYE